MGRTSSISGRTSRARKSTAAGRSARLISQPVAKVDLVSEVVTRLRAVVLNGDFEAAGDLPTEGELSKGFGVSRTVVREALRVLQAQGLISLSQGRRPRVRPIDPQVPTESLGIYFERQRAQLADLVEARRPIEGAIAALAASRIDDAAIAQLEESNAKLKAAKRLDDRVEADMRFHELLAEATGNPIFLTLMQTIWGLLRQSRYFTIPRSGVTATATGHQRILDAVRRHDSDRARQAMYAHLDEAAILLKDHPECPISEG